MKYTKENIEKRRRKVEISKKTFAILMYIILIPIIFYNSMLIVKAATNAHETPDAFGFKTFVIISGSMEPTLDIGDVVLVKKVDENELKEGDVISFRNGESIITHRINKIEFDKFGKKSYETKGDNNNITDRTLVKYADIEGKYINRIPYLGNIVLVLKNKIVLIIIIIIFYMMYMHNASVEDRRIMRKEKRRVLKDKYKR